MPERGGKGGVHGFHHQDDVEVFGRACVDPLQAENGMQCTAANEDVFILVFDEALAEEC